MARLPKARFAPVLAEFVRQGVANKADGLFRLGAHIVASAIASGSMAKRIDEAVPMLQALGIADASGCIDVELAGPVLRKAMQDSGGKVLCCPSLGGGLWVDVNDVDMLVNIARKHAE